MREIAGRADVARARDQIGGREEDEQARQVGRENEKIGNDDNNESSNQNRQSRQAE